MKNTPFFFKTPTFDGCFGEYRLNVPSLYEIPRFLLFRICPANSITWILFSNVWIYKCYPFKNDFYLTILVQKLFGQLSISDKFIYLEKQRSKVLSYLDTLFCRQSVGTRVFWHSRYSGIQGTEALKVLRHFRHSRTRRTLGYAGTRGIWAHRHLGTWGTLFSRLQVIPLTGILSMFAKFLIVTIHY